MPSVTFTPVQPIIHQALGTPPPGATAVIIHFQVTPPPGATGNTRLVHLRTLNSVLHPSLPSEGRLPRESEVAELNVRNGVLSAGFSGKGGKNAKNPVIHMGGMPPGPFPVTVTVPFTGRAAVVAAGSLVATSDTDIAPGGQPLELLLGMEMIAGADLQPPIGYSVSWDDAAVEWPGESQPAPSLQPPHPPASVPPAPPPMMIVPVPQPPAAPALPAQPPGLPPGAPGTDARTAAITLALQLLASHVSPQEGAALQAILPLLTSGGQINVQALLIALLPLLLQQGGK